MSTEKHWLSGAWFRRHCRFTIILSILILLTSGAVEAREVSRKEAERVAVQWIKRDNARWEQRLTNGPFRHSMTRELFEEGDLVGYVVDLEPSGFLIVPAFTELSPVKFVSYSGHFDEMANHPLIKELRRRLLYSSTRLGYIGSQAEAGLRTLAMNDPVDRNQLRVNEQAWVFDKPAKTVVSPQTITPQMETQTDTETFVAPLITSAWEQGYPYNLQTPLLDGEHTLVGCVAVSLAQVMYFWRYPSEGQGAHNYMWNGEMLSADFAHPYEWANMKDPYRGGETDIEKAAVATLMSDAGIAVEMNYGLEGSGAYSSACESALESFFKYSPDARKVYRNDYASWSDWFLVFKDQLDVGRPVLLSIRPPSGGVGHAVVASGYRILDGINQVHLNMGWGGTEDTYFALDDIYASGTDFTSDMATVDIYPSEYFVYAPDAPAGITLGKTGDIYEYQGEPSRDSYSDDRIEYRFDWGDGSSSPWSETPEASHAWAANGSYSVTLQARSVAQPEIVSSPSPGRTVIIDDSLYGTERGALIDFYLNTDGDNWTHNDNWKKPDGSFNDPGTEGTWYGVEWVDNNGHVRSLAFWGDGNNLKGFIPQSIGDLKYLGLLIFCCGSDLDEIPNCIGGKIPDSIGNLANLYRLEFNNCWFEGEIPETIGNLTNLRELSFRGNHLTGPIPASLGNLNNLERLNLGKNSLGGPIPPSIGNISSLKSLTLYFNQLTGAIPTQLGQLENLKDLALSDNFFSGPIPAALGNLTSLINLSLGNNQLDGPIPPEIFSLSNLKEFMLGYNNLGGPIPPELSNLFNLEALFLEYENLSGTLPPEIGNLSKLERLKLQGNQLCGSLPSELGSLSKLTWLELGDNEFSGSIPVGLSNLENLVRLDIIGNRISGPIPKELGNLPKLTHFYASDNELTGSIPKELSGLPSEIDSIYLQNNRLSGPIPGEIFDKLPNLYMFYLHGNMLSGKIPDEILKLTDLNPNSCGRPRINHNALYTSNPAVIDFLNTYLQEGWDTTQTIAPEDLAVGSLTPTSARLSWSPIAYTDDDGGYRIFYAEQPGGEWIEAGMTADKLVDTFDVENLRSDAVYSFLIRTQTDPHDNVICNSNKNTVVSEPGEIVSIGAGDSGDTDDMDRDGLTDTIESSGCTDPNDADTDNDGVLDGVEDANRNGVVDFGETDPCVSDMDSDNDGLSDELEENSCTDPHDADTDDDGIPDGIEDTNGNGVVDISETNPCDPDTDGDRIQDGTELGYTLEDVGPDTDLNVFQPDLDPETTTDPLEKDGYSYYLPYFRGHSNHWTGIGLRNGSESSSAIVDVFIYDTNGNALENDTIFIAPRGHDVFTIGDGQPDEGWIRIDSTQPLVGLCFVATAGTNDYMADIPFTSELSTLLYVPHVGQGPTYDTCIMISNPNTADTYVTLTFVDQQGTPLCTKSKVVKANGSWKYELSDLLNSSKANYGSLEISGDRGLAAFALYDNLKKDGFSYAGISAVKLPDVSDDFSYYLPYFRGHTNHWTGIGLRNGSSSSSAIVDIFVYDTKGDILENDTIHIAARGHDVFTIGDGQPNEGWIRIDSTQPLVGLCFVATTGTNNYMADIPFTSHLSTLLYVPHVGQGPTYDTCIMVCNPNTADTYVTLTFVDQQGTPLYTKSKVVKANGSWKYELKGLLDSSKANYGSVEISAHRGLAAFALYDNLKKNGYSYAGISAVIPPDVSENK